MDVNEAFKIGECVVLAQAFELNPILDGTHNYI